MGVGRFLPKMAGRAIFWQKMGGSGSFLLKIGWEEVAFVEKWVGVCRFVEK